MNFRIWAALFLITAEFTIKNNIRQIRMINIELKSMEKRKIMESSLFDVLVLRM